MPERIKDTVVVIVVVVVVVVGTSNNIDYRDAQGTHKIKRMHGAYTQHVRAESSSLCQINDKQFTNHSMQQLDRLLFVEEGNNIIDRWIHLVPSPSETWFRGMSVGGSSRRV